MLRRRFLGAMTGGFAALLGLHGTKTASNPYDVLKPIGADVGPFDTTRHWLQYERSATRNSNSWDELRGCLDLDGLLKP